MRVETTLPLESELDRWENEGGLVVNTVETSRDETAAVAESFPAVRAGSVELKDLQLVRLVDTRTLGKYLIQQRDSGDAGHVFVVTLFGATCAKVEIVRRTRLEWKDYLIAMKRAIEREIGYWQNRGDALPPGEHAIIEVTVRDTDFAMP